MMESRVKRLEFEHKRAMDSLQRTLATHGKADQVRQRRINDLEFKNSWLHYQNQALTARRITNTQLREERKRNVSDTRHDLLNTNV